MMIRAQSTDRTAVSRVVVGYVLSPLTVAVVAAVVLRIQELVSLADRRYTSPEAIAFLLPIALVTVIGGRGPGILTIVLSEMVCMWILMPPRLTLGVNTASDIAALVSLLVTSTVLVAGVEAVRASIRVQQQATAAVAELHERAQKIATAFQEPLIPRLPALNPGVSIAYHYEPALDEAAVGGDFMDVYPSGDGKTVLVLGDISGKGLAAATQTATVRNMLRLALFRRCPTEYGLALQEVNDAIAAQDLISGFATLFVGCFDPGARSIAWVSCGHEPAFIRRGEGVVELGPTGPIFGAYAGSTYSLGNLSLLPGDVLAIYTDGLSESGTDHQHMLGHDGVKGLLLQSAVDGTPEAIVKSMIDGTKAHASGRLSDDACLLVCKVGD